MKTPASQKQNNKPKCWSLKNNTGGLPLASTNMGIYTHMP